MTNDKENQNKKQYKTFVVHGLKNQKKIWIGAIIMLIAIFWGSQVVFHIAALQDLKDRPDIIDHNDVILQQTQYACGPASLAMLLRDHEMDVTVYEMAKAAHTGVFGTWSQSIPRAGRQYGFKVEMKMLTFDEIIDTNLPMIIEEQEHVVYAVPDLASRLLHVKDPSEGLSILSKEAFYLYFTEREKKKCYVFSKRDN